MTIWIGLLCIGALGLASMEAPALAWLAGTAAWLAAGAWLGLAGPVATAVLAVVLVLPALLLTLKPLRRALVTRPVLATFRAILPEMSQTERDAIEAGTVWWDAELFSGRPDWKRLRAAPVPRLTPEEQAFLDVETGKLCDLANDWESTQVWQDLSPEAWAYAKQAGFLGMIIPREYGGKGFSAYAHSQVVMKLATRCSAAAVSVMVPNSLGPAELLLHYGTDAQKAYYLPRLARGEEIPCFALTNAYAGSDAAAIPDVGVVCRGLHEGRETLGLRVTWSKRYITLGPIATVLGLAFRVVDPDGLLGDDKAPGITCALIPTRHPGVNIGRRHWPLNAVFQNGPNWGKDVFIPIDWVIGGQAQVGRGWRMLMECLAAGRAISLPSSNVGMAKLAVRATGAYAAVRRQFRTPIGQFEGIREALGRMGGNLYTMDAARRLSALAVDLGEKPSVISAMAKYHVTERARDVINDAMDIVGGKGICMGPNNFLARAYQQIPIAITVEGANIMTRCLIIFGQGVIRCHPYVLREMTAAQGADSPASLRAFDAALFGHGAFVAGNLVRALLHALSGGRATAAPSDAAPALRRYYRAVNRFSTALALLADVSMFTLGGTLKRRESLTGRLGDILSQLYLVSAVLKRFEDDGRPADDAALAHWSAQDALARAYDALDGVLANFPNRAVAGVLRMLTFPFGSPYRRPADALSARIAELVQTPGATRDRLVADSYCPAPETDPIAYGEAAFRLQPAVDAIERRLKPAIRAGKLAPVPQSLPEFEAWTAQALAQHLIDEEERARLCDYARYGEHAVAVDDFPPDFNLLADLQRRKAALEALQAAGQHAA
ncbi:acyl-CoA dehydrogenase [Ralstonia pseudosolanacearum]|uniref:acyl-CoA dehydrogenase n=1 Tax=Ralstonia pseudosolanacearum TaxID=1310165 RepID=UPI0007D82756|nr:acyl-CoA dehydrogenase [Ralstonia pseudosolanacearum]MDC6296502.1 acyl-CoA dehydrogenase [Ralstonia pseudosolanacearum]MDD7792476.1 acyl-CoA dehydrogenase [Ralstonia pseudosolanacearum]MDN3366852.1 acyl-CoA dehydrogenase [Ralstonia pseudosolanacearum]OAK92808.1 acyl-CoA dehydrogenase [Ralstonia pseudosolanacearum]QOK86041.1 acyl-CoA dehydrogenase [Ralstonia pseudosolanacearum]